MKVHGNAATKRHGDRHESPMKKAEKVHPTYMQKAFCEHHDRHCDCFRSNRNRGGREHDGGHAAADAESGPPGPPAGCRSNMPEPWSEAWHRQALYPGGVVNTSSADLMPEIKRGTRLEWAHAILPVQGGAA